MAAEDLAVEVSRQERFAEFLGRLEQAPAASTFGQAYELMCRTLNEVEDELSGIPYDPASWRTDGRMYPPEPDSERKVPDRRTVKRFRHRGHNTLIGENGAIEIRTAVAGEIDMSSGEAVLSKAGADGRTVWKL